MYNEDKTLKINYYMPKIIFLFFFLFALPLLVCSLLLFPWDIIFNSGKNPTFQILLLEIDLFFIFPTLFLILYPFSHKIQITPEKIRKRSLLRNKTIYLLDIQSSSLVDRGRYRKELIVLNLRDRMYSLKMGYFSFNDRYEISNFLNLIGKINRAEYHNVITPTLNHEKLVKNFFRSCLNCQSQFEYPRTVFTRAGYCSFRCAIEYRPLQKLGSAFLFIVFGLFLLIFLPRVTIRIGRHSDSEGLIAFIVFILAGFFLAILVASVMLLKKVHAKSRTREKKINKRVEKLDKILLKIKENNSRLNKEFRIILR